MARDRERSGKKGGNDRRRVQKKKVSILTQDKIDYVDYKDVNLLRRFMSERAKIRARRVTGNNQQQQREIARAIRIAREMALLPYSVRQVTQRSRGGRRDRDRAGPERADADAGRTAARSRPRARNGELPEGVSIDAVEELGRDRGARRGRRDRRGGLSREDRPARRCRAARQEGRPARGRARLRPQLPRAARARDRRDARASEKQAAAMRRNREVRDDRDEREQAQGAAAKLVAQPGAGHRRVRARAASCSARSPAADIAAAIEAADRRHRRPAQDRARRAAQGSSVPPRSRSRSTPTSGSR